MSHDPDTIQERWMPWSYDPNALSHNALCSTGYKQDPTATTFRYPAGATPSSVLNWHTTRGGTTDITLIGHCSARSCTSRPTWSTRDDAPTAPGADNVRRTIADRLDVATHGSERPLPAYNSTLSGSRQKVDAERMGQHAIAAHCDKLGIHSDRRLLLDPDVRDTDPWTATPSLPRCAQRNERDVDPGDANASRASSTDTSNGARAPEDQCLPARLPDDCGPQTGHRHPHILAHSVIVEADRLRKGVISLFLPASSTWCHDKSTRFHNKMTIDRTIRRNQHSDTRTRKGGMTPNALTAEILSAYVAHRMWTVLQLCAPRHQSIGATVGRNKNATDIVSVYDGFTMSQAREVDNTSQKDAQFVTALKRYRPTPPSLEMAYLEEVGTDLDPTQECHALASRKNTRHKSNSWSATDPPLHIDIAYLLHRQERFPTSINVYDVVKDLHNDTKFDDSVVDNNERWLTFLDDLRTCPGSWMIMTRHGVNHTDTETLTHRKECADEHGSREDAMEMHADNQAQPSLMEDAAERGGDNRHSTAEDITSQIITESCNAEQRDIIVDHTRSSAISAPLLPNADRTPEHGAMMPYDSLSPMWSRGNDRANDEGKATASSPLASKGGEGSDILARRGFWQGSRRTGITSPIVPDCSFSFLNIYSPTAPHVPRPPLTSTTPPFRSLCDKHDLEISLSSPPLRAIWSVNSPPTKTRMGCKASAIKDRERLSKARMGDGY
ncbi:hypothetical protein EDB86DRAFT_3069963 [Lactarius hatsudake]|nr:hypothetical protein EDB86DRAFT_3069963 [Lactarius hatsudake]